MSTLHSSERIGEAWRHHRDGNNDQAITIFKEIIQKAPKNVDAHYGLGLAYKATNDMASAADAFQNALDCAQSALGGIKTTSAAEGHHGKTDLDTSEDDRFMMLSNMLKQRLADVGVSDSTS